jgi:hypothetical protein
MDWVMKLQAEAPRYGGRVEVLKGNHEGNVAIGDFSAVSERDIPESVDPSSIYQGNSKYAKWIRSRPTMLRLRLSNDERLLLVHAGPGEWMKSFSLEEVNQLVNDWFAYYQGVGPKPRPASARLMGTRGPLWTRAILNTLRPDLGESPTLSRQRLKELLEHYGVDKVVVGHTATQFITDRHEIILHTKEYDDMVIMTDTAISREMGGKVSALRIDRHGNYHPTVYKRPRALPPVTKATRAQGCGSLVQAASGRR